VKFFHSYLRKLEIVGCRLLLAIKLASRAENDKLNKNYDGQSQGEFRQQKINKNGHDKDQLALIY
jgi:Tfp pilus assembly protein PilF